MRLYLMQHGEAVESNVNPDRPLSGRGRRDVERISKFVAASGIRIPRIWHSGKSRARETAEILAANVGGTAAEHAGLRPGDGATTAIELIKGLQEDVAIVGHLPHLSSLAAGLLHARGKHEPIRFQRGGIVALERNGDGLWQVQWMIVPELLIE